MNRYYYREKIEEFVNMKPNEVLGVLSSSNEFNLDINQIYAWKEEIKILQKSLKGYKGGIFFEYTVPRMGRRIDVVLVINSVLFVIEFKVGESEYLASAIDQVWDYALDLKNFHEASHDIVIAPMLVSTKAEYSSNELILNSSNNQVYSPVCSNTEYIREFIDKILFIENRKKIDYVSWGNSRYHPTPTIIEAAIALYKGHSVSEISRSDASAINLKDSSNTIEEIIVNSEKLGHKSICFLTGVPGSGKTLVGLNIATKHYSKENELYSVFLSGNGPLVSVLREALARDKVKIEKEKGKKLRLLDARSEVKAFIQNVHNFRDDCLIDLNKAPIEHVAIFDEAQRAWDLNQTVNFMRRKKGVNDFSQSEPEFLISCMDRHSDWAVILCLVGGGQEINTGEAGIIEWMTAINKAFKDWKVYISPNLIEREYQSSELTNEINNNENVKFINNLHLSVSMRSYRAEWVSSLVKQVLDINPVEATRTLEKIKDKYPILLTRDTEKAKKWLRKIARGSERYGIVVSSQAERLKPYAIDVKTPVNPVHWFLDPKEDVRSSFYLEDVVTEFQIQGLELDWACVVWDADLRFLDHKWGFFSFTGDKWCNIRKAERQKYLINAYRVLLTRARQGMVIVIPEGEKEDPTRKSEFYDGTYKYLENIGFSVL